MNARTLPFIVLSAVALAALLPRTGPAVPTGGPAAAGDVAWMLTATGLVLLMTPGLSFFYGGMVRLQERRLDDAPELHRAWASSACCGSSSASAWRSATAWAASSATR